MKKKIKNALKRLCSKDGFTLVELIVVIAILGILAGIGTVGYSGYVKRANRAADEAMIAEIENALMLGVYSSSTPESFDGTRVTLLKGVANDDNDANASTTAAEDAISAAFGDNWRDMLRLKGDWDATDAVKILGVMQDNDYTDFFSKVTGSSFYQRPDGSDQLETYVDQIATSFNGVLNGVNAQFNTFWGDTFKNNLGEDLKSTILGNDQLKANATVFAVANEIKQKQDNDAESVTRWTNAWANGTNINDGTIKGYVATAAMNLARQAAFVEYVKNERGKEDEIAQELQEEFESLLEDLADIVPAEGQDYLSAYNAVLQDYEDDTVKENYPDEWNTYYHGADNKAADDAKAFIASMLALNSVEDTYMSEENIDLFTGPNAFKTSNMGSVLDTMVNYAGDLDNLPSGDYVIMLSVNNGVPTVTPSIKGN